MRKKKATVWSTVIVINLINNKTVYLQYLNSVLKVLKVWLKNTACCILSKIIKLTAQTLKT